MMLPITEMTADTARALSGVFTDIDGTLTREGKLTADAYLALWRLKAAGLAVVPVTGRPAGWCDLIARQWPVDGVIGENGALAYFERNGRLQRLYHPEAAASENSGRLDALRDEIIEKIKGTRVSKDQAFRMFDLAIDFCEEEPDLGLEVAEEIRALFERRGAHAKISSIHVNGWFGDYDKLSMVRLFAQEAWGNDLDEMKQSYTFCGDSPNDEPMFAFFPHATAVANISSFAETLEHRPRYVALRDGGDGFAEIVETILSLRE